MKIAVIIASVGRPEELGRWVEHCARQTLQPSQIIYSVSSEADLPKHFSPPGALLIFGPKGLTTQRNTGLRAVDPDTDIVSFFDDDYVPSRYCFEGIARLFTACSTVVGASGQLLADGILGPGIPYDKAMALVDRFDEEYSEPELSCKPIIGTYGCNMAFRRSMIEGIEFDERLPLYGWQEDVDFSRRLLSRGMVIQTDAFAGVHQGSKAGRTSGRKLGYSQIANPIYLVRKGSLPMAFATKLMIRNLLANVGKSLRPEPWIDRWGRVQGNWRAIVDLARGRIEPEGIDRL